ncbi:MAG: UPF0149 family protein [Rhodospirillales bacterium]
MSGKLSGKLRQLDTFLLSDAVGDDAMLLSELDGFLAGVIVCPELIMPGEWVSLIWRNGDGPVYEDLEQMQTVNGLIVDHYNDIIRQLDRNEYAPILDIDTRTDETLWEMWVEGFYMALTLRPDAWLSCGDRSTAHKALSTFMRLHQIASTPRSELEPMDIDADLERLAPDMIPVLVHELHIARRALASTPAPAAPANQNLKNVGRNDPCPCGSGKKFKKCCLN